MLKELSTIDIPKYLDVLLKTYEMPLDKTYIQLRNSVASDIYNILDNNETLKNELISLATRNKTQVYKDGKRIAPEDRPEPRIEFIQLAASRFPLKGGIGKLFLNINMKAYIEHSKPLIYIVFAKYEDGKDAACGYGELHTKNWMQEYEVPREILYRYLCHLYRLSDATSLQVYLKGLSFRSEGAFVRTEVLDASGKTLSYELPK